MAGAKTRQETTMDRSIPWLLTLLIQSSLMSGTAGAAPASAASQIAVPVGTSTFAPDRLTRIDRALQQYVDENRLAGVVALVLRDGQPVYERAVGWSDKEAGRKMTTDSIFRIASQTKALTSVAILALVEEGRINLADPVSRFIPTFEKTTVAIAGQGADKDNPATIVPAKRPITIRDLLTHTSGISYGTQPEIAALYAAKGLGPAAGFGWYLADKSEPVCESMERLGTLPFVAQPGEAFVYGYSVDILGCVVERASGVKLDEFIRTRITQPLGMKDTQFFLPKEQRSRLAAVYASDAQGRITRAPDGPKGQGNYIDGPRRNFSGGAGLLSTARDYARFLEMIRRGGELDGVRILAPRTVALMRTNQVGQLHSADGLGFGFGFQTVERYGANGMAAPGAYGWGGAYGSKYHVDPQARLVVVLMIQQLPNGTDIQDKFSNLVYQALLEPLQL
jgi:CubicO group peptidase (beta-lactamase class C family)